MNIPSFYSSPQLNQLSTSIVSSEQSDEHFLIELEDTIFYPEGGGQAADKGWIQGIPVLDVQKQGNKILHKCSRQPAGNEVKLDLDRKHRDFYTAQHTAQHLLSALLMKDLGVQTLSVHLGSQDLSIEVDASELKQEDMIRIETEANRLIRKNLKISSVVVENKDDLNSYSLRRPTDKEKNIRLIQIEGMDVTACGGLHVNSTAEIGLIKYSGQEKIRGRIRCTWLAADCAYKDYELRFNALEKISQSLAVPPSEAVNRLSALLNEKQEMQKDFKTAQEKEAKRMGRSLRESLTEYPPLLIRSLGDTETFSFKTLTKELSNNENLSFLICAEDNERLQWALYLPRQKEFSFPDFKEKCLSLIDGKGGGKGPLWQGSGALLEKHEDFLHAFRKMITN